MSHHLKKNGIDIRATDDFSAGLSNIRFVEKLNHEEALIRYSPEIVIGSYVYPDEIIPDIMGYPTVNHFINIGVESDEIPYGDNWSEKNLESVNGYIICNIDTLSAGHHSLATLYSRNKL